MNINRADGFVKLYKSMAFSDLADDNNAFAVFTRMLMMAHHEDNFASIRFGGRRVYLKRGEFSASMSELCDFFRMSPSTLRGVISRLENDERISKRTDRQKTIFTICNYAKYQDNSINGIANGRRNDMSNDIANVPDAKRNKEIKNNNSRVEKHSQDEELLSLLNEVTHRQFRVLPRGHRITQEKFTLEEIRRALMRLTQDSWHKQRLGELSSDYLLRPTTIDKFLNAEPPKILPSFADRIAAMKGEG